MVSTSHDTTAVKLVFKARWNVLCQEQTRDGQGGLGRQSPAGHSSALSVPSMQPVKHQTDIQPNQQLVWWSLHLFLGDILKRMRRFGCLMYIYYGSLKIKGFGSGRVGEAWARTFYFSKFCKVWIKGQVLHFLPLWKFAEECDWKGSFVWGCLRGWYGEIDGTLNCNSWYHN